MSLLPPLRQPLRIVTTLGVSPEIPPKKSLSEMKELFTQWIATVPLNQSLLNDFSKQILLHYLNQDDELRELVTHIYSTGTAESLTLFFSFHTDIFKYIALNTHHPLLTLTSQGCLGSVKILMDQMGDAYKHLQFSLLRVAIEAFRTCGREQQPIFLELVTFFLSKKINPHRTTPTAAETLDVMTPYQYAARHQLHPILKLLVSSPFDFAPKALERRAYLSSYALPFYDLKEMIRNKEGTDQDLIDLVNQIVDIDVNGLNDCTLLHDAVSCNHILAVTTLLKRGAHPIASNLNDDNTFFLATERAVLGKGNLEIFQALFLRLQQVGINPHTLRCRGYSPLSLAMSAPPSDLRSKVVAFLLDNKDPAALDNDKDAESMCVAAKNDDLQRLKEMFEKLQQQGINPHAVHHENQTPLVIAAKNKACNVVRFLLERSLSPITPFELGECLGNSLKKDHLAIFELFQSQFPNMNFKEIKYLGFPLILHAILNNSIEIFNFLMIQYGLEMPLVRKNPLIIAAIECDRFEMFMRLLDVTPMPECICTDRGDNLLGAAVRYGAYRITEFLLQQPRRGNVDSLLEQKEDAAAADPQPTHPWNMHELMKNGLTPYLNLLYNKHWHLLPLITEKDSAAIEATHQRMRGVLEHCSVSAEDVLILKNPQHNTRITQKTLFAALLLQNIKNIAHRFTVDHFGDFIVDTHKSLECYLITKKVLGQGGLGKVIIAIDMMRGRMLAFKTAIQRNDFERRVKIIRKEVAIIRRLNPDGKSTGIIEPPHFFVDMTHGADRVVGYMMEFYEGNWKSDALQQIFSTHPHFRIECARQVIEGLAHVYAKNYMHNDIKPRNILFKIERNASGHPIKIKCVLADFGGSTHLNNYLTGVQPWGTHTLHYCHTNDIDIYNQFVGVRTPEIVEGTRNIQLARGIYALGMSLDILFKPLLDDVSANLLVKSAITQLIAEMTSADWKVRPNIGQLVARYSEIVTLFQNEFVGMNI